MIKNILGLILLALVVSCNSDTDIDISGIEKGAKFTRFDSAFFNSDTAMTQSEIDRLSTLYPPFFEAGKNPRFWKSQRNEPNQNELYQASKKVLTNFEGLNENLNFSMKHYYY